MRATSEERKTGVTKGRAEKELRTYKVEVYQEANNCWYWFNTDTGEVYVPKMKRDER